MNPLRVVYKKVSKKSKVSPEVEAMTEILAQKWKIRDKKEAEEWIKKRNKPNNNADR